MNSFNEPNTDLQPYLLPNTDPWALPEEKAVSLLNYLNGKGFEHVYCIPPVRQENRNNTVDFLQRTFLLFQQRFSTDSKLKLAARYRLDNGFTPLLKNNELLSIGKYLITDASPLHHHPNTFKMLEAIRKAGYVPVLIQPERTTYWNEDDFIRLERAGVQLMLNLCSLYGYHGDYALMHSRWMLSKGMYTYVCSGIEDMKTMRHSENFVLDADAASAEELARIEANSSMLWMTTGG